MSSAQEMLYLKSEQKMLLNSLKKLKEQKSKLELEELILKGLIRDEKINNAVNEVESSSNLPSSSKQSESPLLDLNVTKALNFLAQGCHFREEEEEEESD